MNKPKKSAPVVCLAGTLAFLGIGITLFTGCQVVGPGGEGEGTLSGTVTSSATDGPLAGVEIGLDPAVDGVDLVTDADGVYSGDVPPGVYTLTFTAANYEAVTSTRNVESGQTTTADAALTPSTAVALSVNVTGDALPGNDLMAKAVVTVLDGTTTVQSYSWAQSNSVEVELAGETTDTVTVSLPDAATYKAELLHVLAEPPISEAQLPPNVPLPEGEFPGGLQNRFYIPGLNPFAMEEAGLVKLMLTVNTSSGTFTEEVEIHAALPWSWSKGIRNVPIREAVLLHGKTQDSYNWALSTPAGSNATLTDAATQNPYFTPDISGLYRVTVTDTTVDPAADLTLEIYAGTYEGVISGQDANGRPLAANCTVCHNDTIAPDTFTPWAQTGHAEIFTDQLNTGDHWGPSCFACHSVGYNPGADNGGLDDAGDYQEWVDAGLINTKNPNAWNTTLANYPDTAQLANIQCESCHGPQNGGAHISGDARISISSDVCAVCHGEPLRHGRFQQWQLSGHANYELATEEGINGSCARCHSGNGFLAWLPVLLDEDPETDPLDNVNVTWTADEVHPITCVACHDPHMVGTLSGDNTDANVYISGNTPPLIGGFTVFGAGKGAICMTCHNSRRGLRNDTNFDEIVASGDASRAPHGSSQTDVLMGQNAFLVDTGVRGAHSLVEDTCVNCHMVQTDPPNLLSYDLGGTNHTFFAGADICVKCHTEVLTAESVNIAFDATSDELQTLVETAIVSLMDDLIAMGNSIDLDGTVVTNTNTIADVVFGESHGQQAITVTLTNDTEIGPVTISSVTVLDGATELGNLYDFADARLIKAGWNYNLANNDGSRGVHNPDFVFEFLDASIDALNALAAE